MTDAIFLSAGVPDPERGAEYAKTADSIAIKSAVSALIYVTMGRRMLVWGGHPSITPMIWVVAGNMGVDYASWIRLYQSKLFKDDFPTENARFKNVSYVESVADDREKSLLAMRERMFTEQRFAAAVFIGGMRGIIDEFELLRKHQPSAVMLPIVSTGGAAGRLADRIGRPPGELASDLNYLRLFHRLLGIPVKEERYARPADQPEAVEDRMWRPPPVFPNSAD